MSDGYSIQLLDSDGNGNFNGEFTVILENTSDVAARYFEFRFNSQVKKIVVNNDENVDSVLRNVAEIFGLDMSNTNLIANGVRLDLENIFFAYGFNPQETVIDVVAEEPPAPAPQTVPVVTNPAPPPPSGDLNYLFKYDDDEFNLSIPASATVADVKQMIAERYGNELDKVSLLFRGRNLKDESLLIHQRIGDKTIIVYIRSMEPIILESIGYGSSLIRVPKPANFNDLVGRLERETGASNRTCSRCLIFYEYDVDRALNALRDESEE
jgi:hypothetical protein